MTGVSFINLYMLIKAVDKWVLAIGGAEAPPNISELS